jgi:hypothetical protein
MKLKQLLLYHEKNDYDRKPNKTNLFREGV